MAFGHRRVLPVKVRVFVGFNGHRFTPSENIELLRSAGVESLCPAGQMHPHYSFDINEDDPRLRRAIEALMNRGQAHTATRRAVYNKEELKKAEILLLSVERPEKGDPQKHTSYDRSNACSICGTGAEQIGPLRLKSNDLPKRSLVAQTYTAELLLCDELACVITGAIGLSADLRQIEETRSHRPLSWWQILPRYRMPPFAAETQGIVRERPCPRCGQDGYFGTMAEPFRPVYRLMSFRDPNGWPRADGAEPPDFARTHEHFGNSCLNLENDPIRSVHYAQPQIMVSNRVMRVFLDNKVRGVRFVPVRILP